MIIINDPDWIRYGHTETGQAVSIALATTVTLRLWLDALVDFAEMCKPTDEVLLLAHRISTELGRRGASPHDAIPHLDA